MIGEGDEKKEMTSENTEILNIMLRYTGKKRNLNHAQKKESSDEITQKP